MVQPSQVERAAGIVVVDGDHASRAAGAEHGREPRQPIGRRLRVIRYATTGAGAIVRHDTAARILTPMRAAILTVSSSVARGENEDRSGVALAQQARDAGAEIAAQDVVADDRAQIERWLRAQVASGRRPDLHDRRHRLHRRRRHARGARAVIEREAPGFAEAMRAESIRHTPMGILTRGVSGIAGRTLIINFPGNPKAIGEVFGVIAPTLGHVVDTLQRRPGAPTPGH